MFGIALIEAFSRGLNWIAFLLAGLLLPAEQFGVYAVVVATLLLFSAIFVTGQDRVILRYLGTKANTTEASVIITCVGSLFFSGILYWLASLNLISMPVSPFVMLVWMFLTAQMTLLVSVARSTEDKRSYLTLRTFYLIFKLCGLIIIVNTSQLASDLVYYECFLTLVFTILGFALIRKSIRFKCKIDDIKHASKFGFPFILHVAAGASLGQIDKLMLASNTSSEQIAQYTFLNTIAGSVFFIYAILNVKWETVIYKTTPRSDAETLMSSLTKYCLLSAAIVLIILNLALPFGLSVISKAHLFDASVLAVLSVAYFVYPFYLQANIRFSWGEKPQAVPLITLVVACINIMLNLVLIPRFGILGAAASTLIAYLALSIASQVVSKRVVR